MQYTIDKTEKAKVTLVLLYSPQHFSECLIHSMDAFRKASDCFATGGSSKGYSNLNYAKAKAEMAKHLASGAQSRKRGAKAAIAEADDILEICDRLKSAQDAIAA